MLKPNEVITKSNLRDIIEIFEDFLERHNVRIPDSDKEMKDDGEDPETNSARIYGMCYGELECDLFGYFSELEEKGTIKRVVDMYDSEIEEIDEINRELEAKMDDLIELLKGWFSNEEKGEET